jgi:predicted DNA-binding antitoxin AbrB/MazE fold protein
MDNASAQRAIFALTWRPGTGVGGVTMLIATMSIKVTYQHGVFVPRQEVKCLRPGQPCVVFSDEELVEISVTLGWLKVAEESFQFWNNAADDVYDELWSIRKDGTA